jgi:hypothetical protein
VKWVTYFVKDELGTVQARIRTPEGEVPSLPPPIVHHVIHSGWKVEAYQSAESGVDVHGMVDWRSIAEQMGEVLQMLADGSEPDPEVRQEHVHWALTDFRIAQMEASVGEPAPSREMTDGET